MTSRQAVKNIKGKQETQDVQSSEDCFSCISCFQIIVVRMPISSIRVICGFRLLHELGEVGIRCLIFSFFLKWGNKVIKVSAPQFLGDLHFFV